MRAEPAVRAELLTPAFTFACRALKDDQQLQQNSGRIYISVDTFHAQVAREAVAAGADIVNDVSGGTLDPLMYSEVPSAMHFTASSASVMFTEEPDGQLDPA